jgi:FKBP-type peptidyl-prolyl cis-trans isomerase FklB
MRIVRAMKHSDPIRLISGCLCAVLVWAAPLKAQPPSQSAPSGQASSGPQSPPAAGVAPAPPPAPEVINDQEASYLFGLTFAEQLRRAGVASQVSTDALMRGVKDALQGKSSTPDDNRKIQQYVNVQMRAASERNKTAAADFLAKNATKKDVHTTASGLQYKVIKPGDANAPAILATDDVDVNYRGRLIDGSEFDNSYSRGVPSTFQVGQVIKGWTEALMMMKPGASYTLYIPPDLAYGERGKPPKIPSNSLLIFDVELVDVKSKPVPGAVPGAPPAAPNAAPGAPPSSK